MNDELGGSILMWIKLCWWFESINLQEWSNDTRMKWNKSVKKQGNDKIHLQDHHQQHHQNNMVMRIIIRIILNSVITTITSKGRKWSSDHNAISAQSWFANRSHDLLCTVDLESETERLFQHFNIRNFFFLDPCTDDLQDPPVNLQNTQITSKIHRYVASFKKCIFEGFALVLMWTSIVLTQEHCNAVKDHSIEFCRWGAGVHMVFAQSCEYKASHVSSPLPVSHHEATRSKGAEDAAADHHLPHHLPHLLPVRPRPLCRGEAGAPVILLRIRCRRRL